MPNKRSILRCAAVVCVCFLFAACASKGGNEVVGQMEGDPDLVVGRDLDYDDNGKMIVLRKGEFFTLSLGVNATAGYQWMNQAWDESLLGLVDKKYRIESDRPGAAGVASWNIEALTAGRTRLQLALCRPWQCDKSTVKTFDLLVHINDTPSEE